MHQPQQQEIAEHDNTNDHILKLDLNHPSLLKTMEEMNQKPQSSKPNNNDIKDILEKVFEDISIIGIGKVFTQQDKLTYTVKDKDNNVYPFLLTSINKDNKPLHLGQEVFIIKSDITSSYFIKSIDKPIKPFIKDNRIVPSDIGFIDIGDYGCVYLQGSAIHLYTVKDSKYTDIELELTNLIDERLNQRFDYHVIIKVFKSVDKAIKTLFKDLNQSKVNHVITSSIDFMTDKLKQHFPNTEIAKLISPKELPKQYRLFKKDNHNPFVEASTNYRLVCYKIYSTLFSKSPPIDHVRAVNLREIIDPELSKMELDTIQSVGICIDLQDEFLHGLRLYDCLNEDFDNLSK